MDLQAGTLPPKASIREIRINQNPFSSEYDKLGYGRIEILTKPGTDQWHGQLYMSGTTAALNSRNPFEHLPEGEDPPGYESTQFSGNIGGPLSKKASIFFNYEQRNINNLNVVSAKRFDPTTFAVVPFSQAVPNPDFRINLSPRLDYQVSAAIRCRFGINIIGRPRTTRVSVRLIWRRWGRTSTTRKIRCR